MKTPTDKQLLAVIEGLCMAMDRVDLDEIYKIAHLAKHKECPHRDWTKQFFETQKELKEDKVI